MRGHLAQVRRGPTAVEQLSRADRAARGRMPGRWPRWSRMRSSRRAGRGIRSGCCWGRRSRGCRSWCRSGTGGCWCRRSRSTGGRRCRWRRTWPQRLPRGCGCSCAGTRTCPISARSPRRNGGWSSTSTTSTRPCPARSSGTSSGWPPAWPWPGGTTGSPPKPAARSPWRRPRATAPRCAPSPEQPLLDVWYAHLDIEQAIGRVPVPDQGEKVQGRREAAGQGAHRRQHEGAGQADHRGRRAAADHQRPADDRPRRRGLRRRAGRRDLPADPHRAGQVPADPAVRPAAPAGAVHAGPGGPQGRRGRQRRHPRLDRADGRRRRRRAAVPAGQGGPAVRPGGVLRGAASTPTRASGSSPGST